MKRYPSMMSYRKAFITLKGSLAGAAMAALALLASAAPAQAQVLTYSSNQRQIKVGVVIPRSFAQRPNAPRRSSAPYLFHALDQRADLKPSGWNLVNPTAGDRVDQFLLDRWNATPNYTGNPTQANPYVKDLTLSKNMAGYWEVPLETTSVQALSDFDLLYLAPPQLPPTLGTALTIDERDKLRKAVDSGAILWVERPQLALGSDAWSYGLFLGYEFGNGLASAGPVRPTQALHPLLTAPYPITQGEMNDLFGRDILNLRQKPIVIPGGIQSNDRPVITRLIQSQLQQDIVMAGYYGSGYVVMTTNIGQQINSRVGRGETGIEWVNGNLGGVSGTDFANIPISAMKFAYNVLSAKQEAPQERYVPRRTSSTSEQVNAPLTRKWTYPEQPADPNAAGFNNANLQNSASPVVYKGIAYVPASNGRLYAFDLDPARDLDGDGNPDDGLNANAPVAYDLGTGASYDVLWVAELNQRMSTPVAATLPQTIGDPIDVVYVATGDGRLHAFDALPRQNNRLSPTAVARWGSGVTVSEVGYPLPTRLQGKVDPRVPAPVFGEGRLFAVGNRDQQGIVRELNPLTGGEIWQYYQPSKPAGAQAPRIGHILATPVLAWVHDEATGAKDLVLYVPTLADPTQSQTARIFTFLLAVRGEKLNPMGSGVDFHSRYWVAPNNFKWLGNPGVDYFIRIPGSLFGGTLIEPGRVRLAAPLPAGAEGPFADYNLDPTDANYKPRSTFYAFPGNTGNYPDFISSPVLGPDDILYAVASDFGRNISGLFAFVDQSPVAYVKWRYTLNDTVVLGSPAYHKGAVFVGTSRGNLAGFDANPTFYIDLQYPINESQKHQIQILQTDPTLPAGQNQVSFTYNQSMYEAANISEPDPLTGQFGLHGRLILKRFSLTGSISLDAGRDVLVRYPTTNQTGNSEETRTIKAITSLCAGSATPPPPGTPSTPGGPLFPGGLGGQQQGNLLFFVTVSPTGPAPMPGSLIPGQPLVSSPTVAGNRLFIGGEDGIVYSMPADPCALAGAGSFTSQVRPIPATIPFTDSPGIGAPQATPPLAIRSPVVISNDKLIANTPRGVMVFHQPTTLVADAKRILEIENKYDPQLGTPGSPTTSPVTGLNLGGSEVIWSLSNTTRYNTLPQPGRGVVPTFTTPLPSPERRALAHPGGVLRLTATNFLVADSGNNRVVEVDRAGTVLWEMTSFADPYNILGGTQPLTLSTPTDLQRWSVTTPNSVAVHTLIVDSGNRRILEIRDVYPRSSRVTPEYHTLVWASRTDNYEYRSAQRINGQQLGLPPGEYTLASVANVQVNSAEVNGIKPIADTDGSSIVILDGPARDASGNLVLTANGQLQYAGGKVAAFGNRLSFPTSGNRSETIYLSNPTSFQRYYSGIGTQQVRGLLTDGNGFYDVLLRMDPTDRRLTLLVASGVVGRPELKEIAPDVLIDDARAAGVVSAKRLPNGNTLILNQATGQIFEHDPTITDPSMRFLTVTPSTQNTHALSQPSSLDRTN